MRQIKQEQGYLGFIEQVTAQILKQSPQLADTAQLRSTLDAEWAKLSAVQRKYFEKAP